MYCICSIIAFLIAGFGVVTPKTNTGKLVLIPYALIGIPMMLAYLSYIGSVLSDWTDQVMRCIHKIVKGNRPLKYKRLKHCFYLFIGMWLVIVCALLEFVFSPTLSWLDGLYFYFVTFTTIGFGDIVEPASAIQFYLIKLFLGLSIASGVVDSLLDLRHWIGWGSHGGTQKCLCCHYIEETEDNAEDESPSVVCDTQL